MKSFLRYSLPALMLLTMSSTIYCSQTFASETQAAALEFTPPTYIDGSIRRLYYPGGELAMARSGRVLISMVVDAKGNVIEPMVEQANSDRFIESALKRVSDAKYQPARLNGEPVASWQRFTARFDISADSNPRRTSSKLFMKHFNRFNDEAARNQPDQETLQKLLTKMAGARHGDSEIQELLSLARYRYAEKFESEQAQIHALREMLLSNDRRLAQLDSNPADIPLIRLLLKNKLLIQALEAYESAKTKYSDQELELITGLFEGDMKSIRQMLAGNNLYQRPIDIGPTGYTFLTLVKSKFALSGHEGLVTHYKLRCMHHFQEMSFVGEFEIPREWGVCQLQIIGDPGTKGTLSQF